MFGRPDTFNVEYLKNKVVKTVKYPAQKLINIPAIPLIAKDDSSFSVYKRATIKYKFLDTSKKTVFVKIASFSRKGYRKAYKKIFRAND